MLWRSPRFDFQECIVTKTENFSNVQFKNWVGWLHGSSLNWLEWGLPRIQVNPKPLQIFFGNDGLSNIHFSSYILQKLYLIPVLFYRS